MSEPEDFLSRWSRRKRASAEPAKPAPPKATPADDAEPARQTAGLTPDTGKAAPAGQQTPFDISSLPPLESIGPQSDIGAFLAKGVPGELSRAALRRAWSADPAIRDFVGLAEYAWDFTAPDSMPGFGPLLPSDDVKRMLAQIFSQDGIESPASSGEVPAEAGTSSESAQRIGSNPNAEPHEFVDNASKEKEEDPQTFEEQPNNTAITAQDREQKNEEDIAAQQETRPAEAKIASVRRGHGGALPS
jgi:uncharacterized protein DUF3306